jgi:VCBS repeat-containing protein
MSHPAVVPTSPGCRPGAARPSVIRRRAAVLAAALLVVGALAAPSAVLAANASPTPQIDTFTGNEDTVITGNVLANDTDPDGDPLTVSSYTPTTYGTLSITPATGAVTYTPIANWSGSETTTYRVSDGQGGNTMSYVTFKVLPVNDLPVCADASSSGAEDAGQAGTLACTDVDGDTLAYERVAAAAHGTASVASGGAWTYAPAADFAGGDSFTFRASDGTAFSGVATMSITVTQVNDAPVAVADTATVAQNSGPATYNVVANDTDADGDTLTVTGASVDPAAGTVSVASLTTAARALSVAPANAVTFTPADLFEGDAVVTYTISDGHGGTANGTLTVTVVKDDSPPVPTAPVVHLGTGRVFSMAPVAIAWSASDVGGTGVAKYEVQVSVAGGPWIAVSTGSATSVNRTYPLGSSLVFQVRATDRAENASGWIASAARTPTAYQAPGSSAVTYYGTWTTVTSASASGGAYRQSTVRGAAASLRFTGREVAYVAPKTSASGYVKVYVDGVFAARYNLRSSSTAPGQIMFGRTWSSSGTHTIKVVNDQAGARANLDAFVVLR